MRFLNLMPRLSALSLNIHPRYETTFTTYISHNSPLTHLSLSELKWRDLTGYFSEQGLTFHSLLYLDLIFDDRSPDSNPISGQRVEWVVPSITTRPNPSWFSPMHSRGYRVILLQVRTKGQRIRQSCSLLSSSILAICNSV
ncbi:hypothetical protein CPB86DRAFT_283141 [Serendipita vermifera]|nr:hypothetical protein CPB86DRAFT_283141 [Serendipita vermifera]